MATKNLEIYRGDSHNIAVNFTANAAGVVENGAIWFTLKENKTDLDEDAILQKTEAIVVDPETDIGAGTINLTPANTNIEPKKYYYDIQFVNTDGSVVKTLIEGTIKILVDITRSI